jgi:ankyrin repeat protein
MTGPLGDTDEPALLTLLRLIAAGNSRAASNLLSQSPQLARMAISSGATRAEASAYYFDEIMHYVYAGDTALHIAAAAYQLEAAEELVSRRANVSARNRRGAQPLHYAADGHPESRSWNPDAQHAVVEFLIRAGADPNPEDKSGVAPLHRAVRTRCTSAVRALLSSGADVRQRNKSGSTPFHLAVQNTGRGGSGSAASRKEQAEIIRLLLSYGARSEDKDAAGKPVRDCVKVEWIRELLRSLERQVFKG